MRNLSLLRSGLIAAGALVFTAFAANAQDYDDYYNAPYVSDTNETVHVIAPRYAGPRYNKYHAPYVNASLSQPVSYDDLDLRTYGGARILKDRIRLTARLMCRELDERMPVTADFSPSCYKNAVADAMYQANMAIANARGYRTYSD